MKSNSKYKNIIFDLGGVLVYWKPLLIVEDIFKDKEHMPPEKWLEILHSTIWDSLMRGDLSHKQAVKALPEQYNKEQFAIFISTIYKYLNPLPEGLKILDLVKNAGYKTYILSNFIKECFDAASPKFHFLEKFDGAIFSYKVNAIKPTPQIYQTLLKTYSLKAEECLFIDDEEINIKGAQESGIDGVVCKNHECLLVELMNRKILL